MNTQMVDLRGQYVRIRSEIDRAVGRVLQSGQYIRGPEVAAFEEELARYLGTDHAVGVANGTDALQIAYMALGIGPGDEVITPAFTFIATAEAAALLGATPVFADIDPNTFNVDPASVSKCVTERTRAIVPVHLFGQPADMVPILELGRRFDIPVIEDNAQAIGARYRGQHTGSMGLMSICSFFPSKNLGAYGDGGAVLTSNAALAERIRMITNHGGRHKYLNEIVGLNSRLDALQAAILRVKLRHLGAFARARREAARYYDHLLKDVPTVTVPHQAASASHVYHQYVIRVPERDRLTQAMKAADLPFGVYYPQPLHHLPVFDRHAARTGSLPHCELACQEVLALPIHTELTRAEQDVIAQVIMDHVTAYV